MVWRDEARTQAMRVAYWNCWVLWFFLWPLPAFGLDIFLSETLPWAYRKAEGQAFDGVGVRIAREISKRSGLEFNIDVFPSARHMTQFKTMGRALSLAMEHNFQDSDGPILSVIAKYPIVVMTKQGSKVKTYEDLIPFSQELGIGVLRGLTYKPLTDDDRIKKVPINDVPSGLRMLASGRLAGIAGSQPLLIANTRRLHLQELPGPLVVIGETTFVLRKRPDTLDSVQHGKVVDAVKSMHKDGTVDRIFQEILNDKNL